MDKTSRIVLSCVNRIANEARKDYIKETWEVYIADVAYNIYIRSSMCDSTTLAPLLISKIIHFAFYTKQVICNLLRNGLGL